MTIFDIVLWVFAAIGFVTAVVLLFLTYAFREEPEERRDRWGF